MNFIIRLTRVESNRFRLTITGIYLCLLSTVLLRILDLDFTQLGMRRLLLSDLPDCGHQSLPRLCGIVLELGR